jgi:hypothetical protein
MPAKDKGEVGASHPGSQLATGSFFLQPTVPDLCHARVKTGFAMASRATRFAAIRMCE